MPGLGYTNKIYEQKNYGKTNEINRKRYVKTCAICGAKFETMIPNVKYCSLICKETARKRNNDRWLSTKPGYTAERMREYRKRLKEK